MSLVRTINVARACLNLTNSRIGTSRAERYRRAMEGHRIRDEAGNLVPMRFSDSQEILWRYVAPKLDRHEKLWFIVLKGRQVYATTFFENLVFTRTMERGLTNSLIIAQDLDSAGAIFGMAKRFYDNLPLPKLKDPRTKEISFPLPDGESVFRVISAGTASKGRGTTQSCVHASEVAFYPNAEVLAGLFQAMPDLPETVWVIESTANGMTGTGKVFYDQWRLAVRGESQLTPIFIPWFIMPKYRLMESLDQDEWDEEEQSLVEQFGDLGLDGHSLAWRRSIINTKLNGLVEMFRQEYPSTPGEAFITSGLPAFDPISLLRQQKNIQPPKYRGTMEEGKFIPRARGEVWIWEEPKINNHYFIGVDTSEGIKGGDYSCGQIINMTTLTQVGLFHGSIQPWDTAKLIFDLGKWYYNAMVNVEIKGSGHAVQDYLMRVFHYSRLHPWKGKADHYQTGQSRLWGWDTNVYSRPLLIEAGRRALSKSLLTLRDEATLEELRNFSRQDNGKYEATAGHDDRVMALLLALRSGEENYLGPNNPALQINPEELFVTHPDTRGIRVIDTTDPRKLGIQRIHRLLQSEGKRAVKTWMEH